MNRHIVLIPGYYGSRLRDRLSNTLFWLSTFTFQKPEHTLEGIRLPDSDGRVFVDGIVDNIEILPIFRIPIYHKLIAFLVNGMGYARNEVHAIGVDWRRSLTELIDDVKVAVDEAFELTEQKVDLIAHSHGGLVARAYLQKFGSDRVEKLITLGVPHTGMLVTFKALCEGIALLKFNPEQLMDVARAFPSAYELLPLEKGDGYFTWNDVASSPYVVNDWCATAAMKAMLAAASVVTPALSRNVPVPLFALHGTRTKTLTSAIGPASGTTGVDFDSSDAGDGTVPLASGAATHITAAGGVKRFAVPFGGHAFLFDDRNTQEVIRHILRGDAFPAAYFVSAWEHTIYLANTDNRVVVVLDDFDGNPIPNATVTLTISRLGMTEMPLARDAANGDYVLTVRMPSAGPLRFVINASAPTLPKPFEASGILLSTTN
jgi:pimeloyl-ACP methyl ester carboxylesterase